MGKKFIIILIAVVIAAGAFVYFFVFQNNDKDEKQQVYYDYAIKDPFITNVKNSSKLFKTAIVLVVDKEKTSKTLGENLFTIRDTILFLLRNMTEEDLKSQNVQDTLRKTIPEKLNKVLDIEGIVSVRFSDFVMQ